LGGGGGVILVKSVLEDIPIYWVSLDFILKGVLEMIRRINFRFLWSRDSKKKGDSLGKMEKYYISKRDGWMGLEKHPPIWKRFGYILCLEVVF
jgi:hypothetical protein